MTDHDLHISKRLKALLPPLTAAEKKQLEANLVEDGRVLDPILFWYDGERKFIIDGMHRFQIATKNDLPYETDRVEIDGDLEDVEIWILDHQLGRRNLLAPQALRKTRGELYNRLKRKDGGHGDQRAGGQNVTPNPDAAEKIAEKAGVSSRTVKRDGKRVETLEKCAHAVQKAVANGTMKASDADLKTLSRLPEGDQQAVVTAIRKGRAKSVKEAMELDGITTPAKKSKGKPDYGKCPSCAGTKWVEAKEGVSCAKCNHPHGEPAGDVDEDRITTQRQKTVKTGEALMRAFDDLQTMRARAEHDGKQNSGADAISVVKNLGVIKTCKALLNIAKGWK